MSDQHEAFEERAAIIQFGSGIPSMTRQQAEKIAAEQMGLTDDEAALLIGEKNDECSWAALLMGEKNDECS